MIAEDPSLRPLVEMEFQKRDKCYVCKCDRKSLIEYVIRWKQMHYGSSRYVWRGGRSSEKQQHVETVCRKCAQKFAADNNLPLPPAPHADPTAGQIWNHWRTSTIVVIVGLRENEAALCPEVVFAPAVSLNGSMHDALLTSGFLSEFDPVGSP